MADRGFKHNEPSLLGLDVSLQGHSTVSGNKLPTEEIKETKEITSLRINIESQSSDTSGTFLF